MTPEEEVKGLNKLIRQYETVFRTTTDPDQRIRVQRQLKDLREYREKILAVHVINEADLADERVMRDDPLDHAPLLRALLAKNETDTRADAVPPFSAPNAEPTKIQLEMFHLALYVRYYEKEYLPFLTEKQLKLDFGLSFDRDRFYNTFQALERKMASYREENRRILEGMVGRDMELEVRKRNSMLTRLDPGGGRALLPDDHAVLRRADRGCARRHGEVPQLQRGDPLRPYRGNPRPAGAHRGRRPRGPACLRFRGGRVPEHAGDRGPGDRACK